MAALVLTLKDLDLMFTIYNHLGIDANKEIVAFGTRPIEIIRCS